MTDLQAYKFITNNHIPYEWVAGSVIITIDFQLKKELEKLIDGILIYYTYQGLYEIDMEQFDLNLKEVFEPPVLTFNFYNN